MAVVGHRMIQVFGPQFEDERSLAARQIASQLMRFIKASILAMLVQVLLVCALLVGLYFKKSEAFGVTQSGVVFKLEAYRK